MPVSAQTSTANDSGFTTHYVAQDGSEDDYSAGGEEASGGDDSYSEQYQGTQDGGDNGEYAETVDTGGSGGRVSLATVFVNMIGTSLLIVFLLAIPISFTMVSCAIVWKIGMVMRGGKKPDIG
jgi:hypothetical protein